MADYTLDVYFQEAHKEAADLFINMATQRIVPRAKKLKKTLEDRFTSPTISAEEGATIEAMLDWLDVITNLNLYRYQTLDKLNSLHNKNFRRAWQLHRNAPLFSREFLAILEDFSDALLRFTKTVGNLDSDYANIVRMHRNSRAAGLFLQATVRGIKQYIANTFYDSTRRQIMVRV